jgi:hypothetical protein
MLIYPTVPSPISESTPQTRPLFQENRGKNSGVDSEKNAELQGQELRAKMHEVFRKGTEEDFVKTVLKHSKYTEEEAHQLFQSQVESGSLGRNSDGFWEWV